MALNIIDFGARREAGREPLYVLGGAGARLERALIAFMLDQHTSRGYKEWWVPALNAATLTGTGQLPKFEEDLFHTTEGLYLIPTAEVQLTNLHAGEVLDADSLPLHYCAFTLCFREEVEVRPRYPRHHSRAPVLQGGDGEVRHTRDRFRRAGIHGGRRREHPAAAEAALSRHQPVHRRHRVLLREDLRRGSVAAQLRRLQGDLPRCCCTDFQARRANIKYRDPANFKGSRFVYTLNGSGLAVGRTMAAVIENYQNPDGTITVPEVLVPYMGGKTVIGPKRSKEPWKSSRRRRPRRPVPAWPPSPRVVSAPLRRQPPRRRRRSRRLRRAASSGEGDGAREVRKEGRPFEHCAFSKRRHPV